MNCQYGIRDVTISVFVPVCLSVVNVSIYVNVSPWLCMAAPRLSSACALGLALGHLNQTNLAKRDTRARNN